ncbi:MAG: MFS transporter [Pseudomonadota bacterium]
MTTEAETRTESGEGQSAPVQAPLGGARAWFVWSLSAMAFGYAFFHRVAPSVMVSDLMSEFAIGAALLGTLSALYFYPYVLLQVPLGALLDRLGARKLLFTALSCATLGSVIFAMAPSLGWAYLGRILVGIGSAVGFLSSLSLAAQWFPQRRFAMLAGLTMFFGMMSGVLAQTPLALFVEQFGWRASMWALGGFGGLLAIMILIFVRNSPHGNGRTVSENAESWGDIWRGFSRAIKMAEVWKIAIVAAAMSGPMLALGGLWGTPYLMAAYDLTRPNAAFYVSFLFFAWAIGAPASGWLSEHVGSYRTMLLAGAAILTVAVGMLTFLPSAPLWLTVVLLIVTGLSGSAMAVCFALVRQVSPTVISGSVSGIVNSMTVASGALLQPVIGLALDMLWAGEIENGSRVYQAETYQNAFILIFVVVLLGFIVGLRIKRVAQ